MKNILFITTQFPYPMDNGGKIGAFNGINVISQNNRVSVLSFTETNSDLVEEGINYFKSILPNVKFFQPVVHNIHIRKKKFKLASAIIRGIITNTPYAISKFQNNQMYKLIDEIFEKDFWDIVFIDYINVTQYGLYIKKKYKNRYKHIIFKDHNIEYELIAQESKKYSGIKKIILNGDCKRTFQREVYMCKNSDLVFSVCDDNTEFLRKFNHNSFTMSPTYDVTMVDKSLNKKLNNKIVFIGGLAWQPNINGLLWFVKEVFPKIQKKIPDVVLNIIGSGGDEFFWENINGVVYKGYVKDLSSEYKEGDVLIVPLFEASGIRIKILEAFANNIPVVSTEIGCSTIGAQNGKELLIANTAIEFSDAVISLLQDNKLNYQVASNARDFLCQNYSLTHRCEEFEEIISKL